MRKMKGLLIGGFSAVAALCFGFGFGINLAKADTAIPEEVTGTATQAVMGKVTLESFTITDGASVRIKNPNGIRFETSISPMDLAKLPDNATFGTLIVPKAVLNGTELTLASVTTHSALNVEANVWREKSTAMSYVYSGVLIGTDEMDFPQEFYGEKIMARSYVTYTDSAMQEYVIYTEATERSMVYVAGAAIKGSVGKVQGEEGYISPDGITFLSGVVDAVVEEISFLQGGDAVTTLEILKGESVTLTLDGTEGIPAIFETTGGIEFDGTKLTAVTAGEATLTAKVGTRTTTVNVTVTQTVKQQIAETLTDGQIAMFNSELYASLFSKGTIDKYNSDTATAMTYFAPDRYRHGNVVYTSATSGTAFNIEFPVVNTYTEGYLAITISFNNEDQASNINFRVFGYGETDSTKGTTFNKFIKTAQTVYVPMSAIVNENNQLNGVQIAWSNWGGEVFVYSMVYSPVAYAIEETISSGEYIVGNSYDVTCGVAVDGVVDNTLDVVYEIADPTVVTIENGKLNALKSGQTKVTVKYVKDDVCLAVKYFNVIAGKSYVEEIMEELGENELANFNSIAYLKTLSDMTVTSATYNQGALTATPTIVTVGGESYLKYRTMSGNNGSGLTVTFVKQNKYEGDQLNGYLKVRVYFEKANAYRAMYFYKHGETGTTAALSVASNTALNGAGAVDLYIPINELVDSEGVLKGVQFTTRYFGDGHVYIGAMTYVTEKPAA